MCMCMFVIRLNKSAMPTEMRWWWLVRRYQIRALCPIGLDRWRSLLGRSLFPYLHWPRVVQDLKLDGWRSIVLQLPVHPNPNSTSPLELQFILPNNTRYNPYMQHPLVSYSCDMWCSNRPPPLSSCRPSMHINDISITVISLIDS